MAVIPMQKLAYYVPKSQTDDFLRVVQKYAAFEIDQSAAPADLVASQLPDMQHGELAARLEQALAFASGYTEAPSAYHTFRYGSGVSLSELQIASYLHEVDDLQSALGSVETLRYELNTVDQQITALEEKRASLEPFADLGAPLQSLRTSRTQSFVVQRNGVLVEDIVAALARDGVVAHATELDSRALVTIYMQMLETDAAVRLLEATTVDVYDTPAVTGVASEALQEVADALVGLAATRDGIVVRVRAAVAEHHILLATYAELFSWVRARSDAAQLGAATATAHVYTGWLQAPLRETVESELSDAGVAFAKSDVPLAANEEPPVEIKNNRLIQPFEAVTRLYGMPGYKDLDPTLFLAGFFFLFFGLSLTDVGYGLSLVAVSAIVLLFGKVNDTIRSFMKLLLFIGSATVLVGMLFGGYFGIDIGLLPAPLQALQVFDPIGNPLPVFYLALGLGVFQVMVGLLLRIYSDARNGQFLDGLWEQGPWLFLFGVGITYVLSIVEWVAVSPELLTRLTYAGLALLVVGALRKSTGVLSALMNVFGSLYNSVGFLSDILSYSRLLALGLATTALAFAVNLIAGIVYEAVPYVGVVFAILILIIGHTFTLAVNTLGAFIHSARLQFVEFFGKFVVGTGRAFKPLARSYNHVTVTKE